jgi:3-methyladenine DNA glycosylase Mpg
VPHRGVRKDRTCTATCGQHSKCHLLAVPGSTMTHCYRGMQVCMRVVQRMRNLRMEIKAAPLYS